MNRGDDADKEIESNPVASLQARVDRFSADAGHARRSVGVIGGSEVHVVRQLTMNADRLEAMENGVARTLQHNRLWALGFGLWALGFGLWAFGFGLGYGFFSIVTRLMSMRVAGASPLSGVASIFCTTSSPSTTRPKT